MHATQPGYLRLPLVTVVSPFDAVFETKVKLTNRADALDCVVTPDEMCDFCIRVVNTTVQDIELNQ